MDQDSILSREEIDTLLAAIGTPSSPPPSVEKWSFEKPRKLISDQLKRLREDHLPLLDSVARAFRAFLKSPVQARLLDPGESSWRELLEGRPADTLVARSGDVLIDPSPQVAFALVERALGGGRLSRPPERALKDHEAAVVTPALEGLLEALAPLWGPAPALRWGQASDMARESGPGESGAVVAIEFLAEGLLGDILLAAPVSRFETRIARPPAPEVAPATGVDIELSARFPVGTLKFGDLRDLAPGDLLVWSGDAAPELTVEVSRRPKFVARPGTLKGKIAVELLKPSGSELPAAPIERVSGGLPPAGAPEVDVEVRAVLAERPISLQELGALRPGALIPFPASGGRTAEVRLGNRGVGRGVVLRTGDRFAVQIQPDIDSTGRGG